MEIGLFQLENLSMIPARFVLLDLRTQAGPVNPHIDRILQKAEKVAPAAVDERLKGADKSAPVILLCEDGKSSAALATRLEAAGFQNIYVVTGGVAGLLSEL